MIARIDLGAIDELKESLQHFSHGPLPQLRHLAREQAEKYWVEEIVDELKKESSAAFVSRVSDRIVALAICCDSPWDTKVVGRRTGTLKHVANVEDACELNELIEEAVRFAVSNGVECLTCKLQPLQFAAIHALERNGFLLVDTLLEFLCDSARTPPQSSTVPKRSDHLKIRLAQSDDLPQVLQLNKKAFANFFGRYNVDPGMPAGTATRVYDQWLRSSFQGWADWILVAEIDGNIAGYGIWRKPSGLERRYSIDLSHYSLAAVDPGFSGRGIYTALAMEGMRIAQADTRYIDGPVHISNYPVQHALQKLGWRVAAARYAFHKWLEA